MRTILSLVLLLSLVVFAGAQIGPPGDPGGGGTSDTIVGVRVTNPIRVKGLQWNGDKHRQEAVFAVSAAPADPIPSGYGHWTYSWSCDPRYGSGEFDDPTAASTNFRALGPGQFLLVCHIHGYKDTDPSAYADGDGGSEFLFAIGGPITTTVSGNSEPTYNHDKNDKRKSWYLTYYGYSHAGATPAYAETTNDGTLTVLAGQPTGTKVTWTLPGSTMSHSALTDVDPTVAIDVEAEGAFTDGAPTAHFTFSGSGTSGAADDDSDATQVSLGQEPNVTWVPLVYKLSGHKPASLTAGEETTQTQAQPPGATYWTNKEQIKYILKDVDSQMPGVWVQERYPVNNLGLNINGYAGTTNNPHADSRVWKTRLLATLDSGLVNAKDGIFNAYDELFYNGWVPPDTADKTTVHVYWAGTSDATANATTGINVGSFTILFSLGNPPASPGTAGQGATPPSP